MKDSNKMTRKLSTNQKLAEFLNKSEIQDEEAEALDQEEKRARERLRITSLYGAGARFQTPKTKKKKKTIESPFQLSSATSNAIKKYEETSSVPPGAHEDQFRRLRYPTEKSMSDPDRVFFTTTSMTEGIRFHPQPPWYYGYQNKTEPTDSCIVLSANRYGYRGAKDIQQYHTAPYLPPQQTANEHTPAFLTKNNNDIPDISNEWVPTIQAKPLTAGYALTTPKLWPENATYANGYEYKDTVPKSPLYIRETTVGSTIRPYTSPSLLKIQDEIQAESMVLCENSKLESEGVIESRPRSQQTLLKKTWSEKLNLYANATLKQTMKREVPPYEAHTLMNQTDKIKYSGSTAMIVHSSSAEELKYQLYTELYHTNIPYEQRWKHVITLFRILRGRLRRDQTIQQAILEFAEVLRKEALLHGNKSILLRSHFIHAILTTELFEHLNPKQISLLFSVYDPYKKSMVSFVHIVAAFTVLNHTFKSRDSHAATQHILTLLTDLWRLYEIYGDEQQPMERVECIFTTCCGSIQDYQAMMKLIKENFRPKLYNLAIKKSQDIYCNNLPNLQENNEIAGGGAVGGRGSATAAPSSTPLPSNSNPKVNSQNQQKISTEKKKHLLIRPVYNIYDSHFDENLFRKLLGLCPEIVQEFNRQLTQRLVLCYGKDPRDLTEEILENQSEKDFSWILTGKK